MRSFIKKIIELKAIQTKNWVKTFQIALKIVVKFQLKTEVIFFKYRDSDSHILVNTSTTSEPTAHSMGANNGVSNGASNGISNGHLNNGQNSPKVPRPTTNGENNNTNNNGEQHQNGVNGSTTEKAMPQPYADEIDDLTSFYKSMEKTTRKFNARLQVKVKRMISDIIYDAEEQWLNTQT